MLRETALHETHNGPRGDCRNHLSSKSVSVRNIGLIQSIDRNSICRAKVAAKKLKNRRRFFLTWGFLTWRRESWRKRLTEKKQFQIWGRKTMLSKHSWRNILWKFCKMCAMPGTSVLWFDSTRITFCEDREFQLSWCDILWWMILCICCLSYCLKKTGSGRGHCIVYYYK